MKTPDKRKFTRHNASPPLAYQLSLSGSKRSARGINHSESGISFENGAEIKPGIIVYIRREQCQPNCNPSGTCLGCRSATLATTRWCRKIKTPEADRYWIGAKYFEF